jgi:hypothetical protein
MLLNQKIELLFINIIVSTNNNTNENIQYNNGLHRHQQ